jgi:hypothetical protein
LRLAADGGREARREQEEPLIRQIEGGVAERVTGANAKGDLAGEGESGTG